MTRCRAPTWCNVPQVHISLNSGVSWKSNKYTSLFFCCCCLVAFLLFRSLTLGTNILPIDKAWLPVCCYCAFLIRARERTWFILMFSNTDALMWEEGDHWWKTVTAQRVEVIHTRCMVERGLRVVCFCLDYITLVKNIWTVAQCDYLLKVLFLVHRIWSAADRQYCPISLQFSFFLWHRNIWLPCCPKSADEFLEWVPWSGLFRPSESNC